MTGLLARVELAQFLRGVRPAFIADEGGRVVPDWMRAELGLSLREPEPLDKARANTGRLMRWYRVLP